MYHEIQAWTVPFQPNDSDNHTPTMPRLHLKSVIFSSQVIIHCDFSPWSPSVIEYR